MFESRMRLEPPKVRQRCALACDFRRIEPDFSRLERQRASPPPRRCGWAGHAVRDAPTFKPARDTLLSAERFP